MHRFENNAAKAATGSLQRIPMADSMKKLMVGTGLSICIGAIGHNYLGISPGSALAFGALTVFFLAGSMGMKGREPGDMHTALTEKNLEDLRRATEIMALSPVFVLERSPAAGAHMTYVSENISRLGYSAETLLAEKTDFHSLIHPEDQERVRRTAEKARQNRQKQYIHMYRVIDGHGDIHWVEDTTALAWDEKGTAVSEKSILRDVTEEVTLNNKMTESEVRFRELFENASSLIFTCDLEGRFTSANRGCMNLLGLDWEELNGKRLHEFLDTDQPPLDLEDFAYLETYLNEPVELKITNAQGITSVLETRNSLLYKNDLPYEIQTVAHNITDQKIAEAQIEYLTYHDRLTGLYNRLYFDMTLRQLAQKEAYPVTIIIGSMNGLKMSNDAFGHRVGDDILILAGSILEDAVSDMQAVVARLSGDEFAILLPGMGKVGANMVCDRIRSSCEQVATPHLRPSMALGYATLSSDEPIEDAMRNAEDNMYHNKLNESRSMRSAVIHSLQASLEEKTTETRTHAERLRSLALRLGRQIKLGANDMDELALSAIMHDIGKIGIPDSVLTKQGPLDEEEWLVMKKHPEVGYHIILSSPSMSKVADFILSHHEKWDGQGYPRGLQHEDIPLISRIIAVVDAYDVMVSERPYKRAMTRDMALKEIERCAGTQFDPVIATAFVKMIRTEELEK